MDTNALIQELNRITKPHFTNGGSHMPTGDQSRDGLVLAAWYARSALDEHEPTDKRVCLLLRAKEEMGKVHIPSLRTGKVTNVDLETVLNAIAWGTSLVCDRIRALEAGRRA